jgi:hypothetical protein
VEFKAAFKKSNNRRIRNSPRDMITNEVNWLVAFLKIYKTNPISPIAVAEDF